MDELQAGLWRSAETGELEVRRIVNRVRYDGERAGLGALDRNGCDGWRKNGRVGPGQFDAPRDGAHRHEPERLPLVVIDARVPVMDLMGLVVTMNRAVVIGRRGMRMLGRQEQRR